MINDKIIQMDNGNSYYILESVEYNGKKYILSLECDLDRDTINEEDCLVMELNMVEDDLIVKRIEDDNLAKIVTTMLLNKVKNN